MIVYRSIIIPVFLDALFMHIIFMSWGVELRITSKWGMCMLVERGIFVKKFLELFIKIESCGLWGNYPSSLRG